MAGDVPVGTTSLTHEDAEHLRLLSIFHYVVAGLQVLMASFPIIHLMVGLFLVVAPLGSGGKPEEALPRVVGVFFVTIAGTLMVIGYSLAVCQVLAGRYLMQRRRHQFCVVVAALSAAMCMPFGTVLGVLTLIVLMRPSVKTAFS
jgi:hypothetical protein